MSIFDDVFRKDYEVLRKTTGEYVEGHWNEGGEVLFIIKASVQPLTSREMDELPEGRRKNQTYKLYTDTQLYTVRNEYQEGIARNPDIIIVPEYATAAGHERFEVIRIFPFQSGIINNYRCIIQLTEQGQ